jgi:hypothetical protein
MIGTPHTGMGAVLQRGDGTSPENFVDVVGIKSMSGPSISRDTHDTTDMSSPQYRTFTGGLVDGGEITFEGNFLPRDPTQYQEPGGLMGEFDFGSCDSLRNWRLLIPDCAGEPESYLEFSAILTAMGLEFPMDDVMSFSGSLKISGRPHLVIETA